MTQGEKFFAWREAHPGSPSQSDIAKKLKVSHPAVISHLENDRYKPGLDLALDIEKMTDGQVKASEWPRTKRKKKPAKKRSKRAAQTEAKSVAA